jgi:chromosome segregation ATPase
MRKIAVTLVACAALACAGSKAQKKPVTVSDADYGRLQPGQTQPVDQARADLGSARDALARAKLRQSEAKGQVGLVEADLQAAASARTRAETLAKQAKASADPVQVEQARAAAESAELRRRTAEAHQQYVRSLEQTRNAEVTAAERRVAYEEARVELAKLQALQEAKVPAATKYQPAELEARVANARKEMEDAENKARTLQSQMANAERQWQELNRQMQASGGAPPRG